MQGSNRRRNIISRNGVPNTSSVGENRFKMDGIKVFDASTGEEQRARVHRTLRRNLSDGVAADERKRKNLRPPELAARNGIQLRKSRSELTDSLENVHEVCPDLSNVDGEKGTRVVEECREDEKEKENFDDKEIDLPVEKPKNVEEEKEIKKLNELRVPRSMEKVSFEAEEEIFECTTGGHYRMQGIVDLVMWRDTSKSAFVFGFGTFFLLSSSYTKDLDFNLISATSYLGLVYLATIFLYKSILHRGGGGGLELDERYIVGEEEAVWLVRLLLPCINELLLKMRALFSGDPATTMKLAVVLFVMGRCGGCITIWTLSKLVFFGVFTIPKVCSSYSVQLARYAKFWLERFRDGWESCTHKKAVAAAAFALIWNLSSTIARMWAVFMLIVAVKFYQQCLVVEEWNGEEDVMTAVEGEEEDSKPVSGPSLGPDLSLIDVASVKKSNKGL